MIWSFSDNRIFRSCQRQWYYKTHVANAVATKDPLRREAYLLSKLQSVPAWRGSIVDHVISRQIVPAIQNKWILNSYKIIQSAKEIFERQAEFANKHRVREPGMSPSKAGDSFAAFYEAEYGLGVSDQALASAWAEIEQSLTNFFEMDKLLALLVAAKNLIPQRNLTFHHYHVTVKAVPDLIAFYDSRSPLIVDWKVHAYASRDYRLQLACYAVALTRCKPQKDFPSSLSNYTATDIHLIEAQLLTRQQREYRLSSFDIDEVDTLITRSSIDMVLGMGDHPNGQLSPFDFPPTKNPESCQRCQFRSLCWKEPNQWDLKQISFL